MPESPSFVFFTCQIGAEPALKHELACEWPRLRFAYSRPGFLTFKLGSNLQLPDKFADKLVFARAAGFCLGKTTGATTAKRAESVWKLIGGQSVSQLHVWPRDRHSPGFRDYEPGMTPEAIEIERVIREAASPQLQISNPNGNSGGRGSRRAAFAGNLPVSGSAGASPSHFHKARRRTAEKMS